MIKKLSQTAQTYKQPVVIIALLAWLGLHLLTLARYPPISCDEGFLTEIGYNFWNEGRFGFDSYLGIAGSDQSVAPLGRLHEILLGLATNLLGVNLWASRVPSLIYIAITALVLYQLGKSISSRITGSLAAVLFVVSWDTLLHGHYARAEAMLAMGSVILIWLLLRASNSPKLAPSFLAGLAAALIVDIHLNGIAFAFSSGAMALWLFITRRRWKNLVAFAIGGLAGLAYWIAVHVLPAPDVFQFQLFEFYNSHGSTDISSAALLDRIRSTGSFWAEYLRKNFFLNSWIVLLTLFSTLWIARQRRSAPRIVVSYIVLAMVFFTAITQIKSWYYSFIWFPLFVLVTAVGIEGLATYLKQKLAWRLSTDTYQIVIALPLIALYILGSTYLMFKYRAADFREYAYELTRHIPEGGSLMASHEFWYLHTDGPFTSTAHVNWENLSRGVELNDEIAAQIPSRAAPGYLITSRSWLCLQSTPPYADVLEASARQKCEWIASSNSAWYPLANLYYCPGK